MGGIERSTARTGRTSSLARDAVAPRPRAGVIARALAAPILRAAAAFPAVVVTGPRRAGKTTLLRTLFPDAHYWLLEEPDVLARVKGDPRGFMEALAPPVILDEVQNAPELFNWVRARIDREPTRKGRWFLTGSQDISLMDGVSESMAGRAAILRLYPLARAETEKVSPFIGGFPEVVKRPADRSIWFESYLQTYIERDVRAVTSIRDLATFRRFLGLLATRHGQVLNRSDLAAPLGVSVPTISEWIGILEVTSVVALVPPWHENLGKRLVKSPKLYFIDAGLVCHLLAMASEAQLRASPLYGAVFEGFVASEILKAQVNAGRRPELYWFRDRTGLEVDFVIPDAAGGTMLVEAKSSRTVRSEMADPILRLQAAMAASPKPARGATRAFVVHDGPALPTTALRPGVQAVDVDGLVAAMGVAEGRRRT